MALYYIIINTRGHMKLFGVLSNFFDAGARPLMQMYYIAYCIAGSTRGHTTKVLLAGYINLLPLKKYSKTYYPLLGRLHTDFLPSMRSARVHNSEF